MLKNDSTSKFVIFQKNKFYIIKNIVSYIYPKSGTLKTPVNSTQRAKYFLDHFKSIIIIIISFYC